MLCPLDGRAYAPNTPSTGPPLGKPATVGKIRSGRKVRWADAYHSVAWRKPGAPEEVRSGSPCRASHHGRGDGLGSAGQIGAGRSAPAPATPGQPSTQSMGLPSAKDLSSGVKSPVITILHQGHLALASKQTECHERPRDARLILQQHNLPLPD